jgi:hypothetical protein
LEDRLGRQLVEDRPVDAGVLETQEGKPHGLGQRLLERLLLGVALGNHHFGQRFVGLLMLGQQLGNLVGLEQPGAFQQGGQFGWSGNDHGTNTTGIPEAKPQ